MLPSIWEPGIKELACLRRTGFVRVQKQFCWYVVKSCDHTWKNAKTFAWFWSLLPLSVGPSVQLKEAKGTPRVRPCLYFHLQDIHLATNRLQLAKVVGLLVLWRLEVMSCFSFSRLLSTNKQFEVAPSPEISSALKFLLGRRHCFFVLCVM